MESLAPVRAWSWEKRARKLGSGPSWIKATTADELTLPPKKFLFLVTFFSWKSQMEYLHWLSDLAMWILRGEENVSKLASIQELEENRLGCQSLFNLFWKIFPLGTLSCLEQMPKRNPTTLQRWHLFYCHCKAFSYIWLITSIPKSPLIYVVHLRIES